MIQSNYLYDRIQTPLTGAALVIWWLLLLVVRGAYEARYLGVGSEEFKRVVTASMTLLAVISTFAYILPVAPPLRLVLPSLLIGMMLILLGSVAAARLAGSAAGAGSLPAEHPAGR